jgi:putative endopeptidase
LIRDEALEQRLVTDVHSPGEFRVDGPLQNVSAFHEAFKIKEGDRMYAKEADRVEIW